jgi:hypothetical protein
MTTLLLTLTAALAAANWYLDPEDAWRWAIGLAFTGVMACVLLTARHISGRVTSGGTAARNAHASIRGAVVIGSLILIAGLGAQLATALGLGSDAYLSELSKRLTMALTGLFFVMTGNSVPKALTPLSAGQCADPARAQAFQRSMGWTWVMTGLAFAAAWLMLPLDVAQPVAITCMFAGMAIIVARIVRLVRSQRPRPSQSGSA